MLEDKLSELILVVESHLKLVKINNANISLNSYSLLSSLQQHQ